MFMGYIASSVYLLEHAIWSHIRGEDGFATDADVFVRWVYDSGFGAVEQEVDRTRSESKLADATNSAIVFGQRVHAKL